MVLHRVMNEVFRSWTHVAVMRALIDTAHGLSGNAVARSAGMHPRSAFKALTALEAQGLIRRQRGGRDHLFTLNRDHVLFEKVIVPVYSGEEGLRASLERALGDILQPLVVSAFIFGSVARGEESPDSDLDLCCITPTGMAKEQVRVALHDAASDLRRRFAVRVSPLFMTRTEFRARASSATVKAILSEGICIAGHDPRKHVHG